MVEVWENLTGVLEGEVVRLEPLAWRHEEGLFEAARDERTWRWLPRGTPVDQDEFRGWMEEALARSEAGLDGAFATVDAQSLTPDNCSTSFTEST